MAVSPADASRLVPRPDPPSGPRTNPTGLPADLLRQSASRLRVLALLYAFVFFMAGFFPALLFADDRARMFGSFLMWGPGAISIAAALVLFVVIRSGRVPSAWVMHLALVFEVLSSYGIAAAEFLEMPGMGVGTGWLGLSWVSVWTLLFTVVVPTPPRRALTAALASVSAVPVIVGLAMMTNHTGLRPSPAQFFFWLVFPYLLVVVMAYVGARVVYSLGTAVTRARELGSYRLVERLGQGGMGEVWRADHRLLARPAAIKLIRPSIDADGRCSISDEARRRFEREAQVTACLRSPHTVTLFDFGTADDGGFYYVMELLNGLDTDHLVRSTGPLPAERVIHVLRQLCHSLSEAESHGLVHRDIKPANIFLCRYGEDDDFVKVLDFGIVKATGPAAATSPSLTRAVEVAGSPAFIAPEQALGAAIDSRADIYATGCVAYWLLTGHLVFTGDTPMSFLLQHAQSVPVAPSVRTELPIPPALDRLVLSCLAKNPADRPQSARELMHLLDAIPLKHPWTAGRARDWWASRGPDPEREARRQRFAAAI